MKLFGLIASLLFCQTLAAQTPAKVTDLNQIDLEEVDESWENQGADASQITNKALRLKVKDILEPTTEYNYASFGKPDPFAVPEARVFGIMPVIPVEGGEAAPIAGSEISMTSVLQGYPIEQLKVKGLWQLPEGDLRALIMTPKGEGVVSKIGDPISSGKIVQLERDALIVRLYKLRKDGVREYEDKRIEIDRGPKKVTDGGVIKLEPGMPPKFIHPEQPADATTGAPVAAPVGGAAPAAAQAGPPRTAPGFKLNTGEPAAPPVTKAADAAPAANGQPWPLNMPPGKAPAAPASGRPGAN